MNKIDIQLEKIRHEKRLGFMTHVVVGYPSLAETSELVKTMDEAGVDFVELQIPFSDPLADGPTIMKACEASLGKGTRVKNSFEIASRLSLEVSMPLLFMAYFNTVFHYGIKKFCSDSQKAGISGLISPDAPLDEEEGKELLEACKTYNLYNIRVLSPSSTEERMKKNAACATGFVYCTARQGITDAKKRLDQHIVSYLKNVREYFQIPIAVGFGISNKTRVDLIKSYCDVAVVGSALIDLINSTSKEKRKTEVMRFLKSLGV